MTNQETLSPNAQTALEVLHAIAASNFAYDDGGDVVAVPVKFWRSSWGWNQGYNAQDGNGPFRKAAQEIHRSKRAKIQAGSVYVKKSDIPDDAAPPRTSKDFSNKIGPRTLEAYQCLKEEGEGALPLDKWEDICHYKWKGTASPRGLRRRFTEALRRLDKNGWIYEKDGMVNAAVSTPEIGYYLAKSDRAGKEEAEDTDPHLLEEFILKCVQASESGVGSSFSLISYMYNKYCLDRGRTPAEPWQKLDKALQNSGYHRWKTERGNIAFSVRVNGKSNEECEKDKKVSSIKKEKPKSSTDSVDWFVRNHTVPGGEKSGKDLYDAYLKCCEKQKYSPVSFGIFVWGLGGLGYKKKETKNGNVVFNLKLKESNNKERGAVKKQTKRNHANTSQSKEVKERGPKNGYDFPEKRKYRTQVWDALLSGKNPKQVKVLILPGKESYEIDELVGRGVKPENIYAVDENPSLIAHASWRKKYPNVNFFGGLVSQCRKKFGDIKFDCANLDFCSNLCEASIKELYACRDIASRIAVTLFKGREQKETTQLLKMSGAQDRLDVCRMLLKDHVNDMQEEFGATGHLRHLITGDYMSGSSRMLWAAWELLTPFECQEIQKQALSLLMPQSASQQQDSLGFNEATDMLRSFRSGYKKMGDLQNRLEGME